jgi:hypothetical protein
MLTRRLIAVSAVAALSGFTAYAQSVISAHSGVLHHSEGAVFLGDQPVDQKYGTFPDIKEKQVMRTEAGRAEVLLTPGVFLRIGENTSFKMISNRLIDTRVDLLGGEAVVESDDPMKENAVTIVYKQFQVHVKKSSVLEFQTNPEQLRVFHGEAEVELSGQVSVVKAGHLMPFTGAMASEKFDVREGDALANWSKRRSEYVATANLSAAKSLRDSGTSWNSSGWYYNPYYSMFTYIPMNGVYMNPYGYSFWSPFSVYRAYYPRTYYYGNGNSNANSGFGGNRGYTSVGTTPSGYSGAIASSPSMSSPSVGGGSASAPVSRGGGSGGGRGR